MTDKTIIEEWENIFFKVYGENIIELYRDAYRYRYPGKPDGNIYFEAGMDFIGMIKSFIHTQLTLAEKRGEEKARKEIITMLPTMKYGETKVHGKKSFQKLGYNAAIDEIIYNLCSLKQSQEEVKNE